MDIYIVTYIYIYIYIYKYIYIVTSCVFVRDCNHENHVPSGYTHNDLYKFLLLNILAVIFCTLVFFSCLSFVILGIII